MALVADEKKQRKATAGCNCQSGVLHAKAFGNLRHETVARQRDDEEQIEINKGEGERCCGACVACKLTQPLPQQAIIGYNARRSDVPQRLQKHFNFLSLHWQLKSNNNLLKVLSQNHRCAAQRFARHIPVCTEHVSQGVEVTIRQNCEHKTGSDGRLLGANHVMSEHNRASRQYRQQNADKQRFCSQPDAQALTDRLVINGLKAAINFCIFLDALWLPF